MRIPLVSALTAVALAFPAPALAAGGAQAGRAAPATVCAIGDKRLDELSGMVAQGDGYVVVNDGVDQASHRKIFFLNSRCRVTRAVSYPSRPRDTEDLARAADGTLWIGDIGDNGGSRSTIALWKLAPGAKSPTLYRLTYPDGPHDAEALLAAPDGTPVIVTKNAGAAGLYTPAGPLSRGKATRLTRAGAVDLPPSTTSNPFSFLGRAYITGAATSPDGRHVALRTYADAFEFDVSGNDVVKALTSTTPRQIPLPDEPQGESVTYSADGRSLLTVSESSGEQAGARPVILRYPLPDRPAASPSVASPSVASPSVASPSPDAALPRPTAVSDPEQLPFNYIAVVAGAASLLGVALAAVLVLRNRARKR
ncbi:hypothetical protein [Paractinoplanes hotanensis]|uniref:Esterase-like activity of phytase family protein n=1 Tax=Paractinoplanes hotanensis TaxID=2906497 RepID=A0ABT0XQU6_9ACTN|nr:hypothetical protein [Actinoplanes hotanensis]MCM4076147.1 hypothetical protein [Actinoplanes hotanensis]